MYRRSFLFSAAALGVAPRQSSIGRTRSSSRDQFGPWVEIDSRAFAFNVSQVRRRTGRDIWAVIKNNGYGHGLVETATCLELESGVRGFAVFKMSSALKLREAGISKPILVMGPSSDEEFEEMLQRQITPTLFTDRSKLLTKLSHRHTRIGAHLYLDTGLGRAGVPYERAGSLLEKLHSVERLHFEGVMTALTEEDEFDMQQIQRLIDVTQQAGSLGIDLGERHAASSAGIFHLPPESFLDAVRPGMALYGCYPTDRSERERPIELHPALSFKTRVMYVKELQSGESLQYHRVWKAPSRTWIATLAVGHQDGWPTATANRCDVLIRGRRYPIVAAVSSNHTLVELGPDTDVEAGDEVLLFGRAGGRSIEAHEVAKKISGSVYQLLMHLNPELPRVIL